MEKLLPKFVAEPSQPESFLSRYWLWIFIAGYGLYVWLPFLAPVLMKIGWTGPAQGIYFIYSFLCHQMPQRSFFLYGPNSMISLADVQTAWQDTTNPLILRQFTGNAGLGWKVAWSDRMVSLYGGIWLAGLLWRPLFARLVRLPWWGLALLALPMAIDGTSHLFSDLAGIGQGFRDTNLWLSALTGNAFSPVFYAGDAFGSFNSWMRLVTGFLFATGVVWFGFPFVEEAFQGRPRNASQSKASTRNQPDAIKKQNELDDRRT